MSIDESPVVVAFDGSPESEAAVTAAARLFPARRLVVVSVWEPGLALALTPPTDSLSGIAYAGPDPDTMRRVDESQHDHATDTAEAGAKLARSLGAEADAHAVAEDVDIAETIASAAQERGAAAVVIGSRGLGRVKSRFLGSTSQGLLRHTHLPVMVVRTPE